MAMTMAMEKEGLGLEITELRLGLPGGGGGCPPMDKKEKKRGFSETVEDQNSSSVASNKVPNKNQIVGWPPVCSYRKKNNVQEKSKSEVSKMYMKISMDGTPYMRKIDLNTHKGYADLIVAFEKLFGCFGKDGVLKDSEGLEYVPIYEDKDRDWMLVGDVPWEMFIESCKKLRIMKRSNATGFGLRSKNSEGTDLGSLTTGESRTEWTGMRV